MCTVEGERKRAQGQGEQQWHRRRRTCQCRRWTPRRAHCLSSCAVTGAPQKASKRSLGSLGTGPPLRYGRRGARCDMAGAERSNRVGFSGRCAQTCASVPRFSLGRHFLLGWFFRVFCPLHLHQTERKAFSCCRRHSRRLRHPRRLALGCRRFFSSSPLLVLVSASQSSCGAPTRSGGHGRMHHSDSECSSAAMSHQSPSAAAAVAPLLQRLQRLPPARYLAFSTSSPAPSARHRRSRYRQR